MPDRTLTVLGSCGAFPEPGRACTGFAIDSDDFHLVLDLGYATLPRLLHRWPATTIDAVIITHEHPDHCIDLHGLFRTRHYGTPAAPRLPHPAYSSASAASNPTPTCTPSSTTTRCPADTPWDRGN